MYVLQIEFKIYCLTGIQFPQKGFQDQGALDIDQSPGSTNRIQ